MKKKYTKKQITEAIAYWKNRLNESWDEPNYVLFDEDDVQYDLDDYTIGDLIVHSQDIATKYDKRHGQVSLEQPLCDWQIVIRPSGTTTYTVSIEETDLPAIERGE